jgi:hypothetical protein
MCIVIAIHIFIYSDNECDNWQIEHPEWIFCDDFESDGPMVTTGRYFEYGDNNGDFVVMEGVGFNNSKGMQVVFQQGEVGAGGMKLAFGRNPNSYMNKQQIFPNKDFREIYYRMYLKMGDGWEGNPAKLSRATVFTSASDWRQAMIAHLWSDGDYHLLLDPASCVNASGAVECTTYNDFDHLSWLGNKSGKTPIFNSDHDDTWFCVEHHVKLNDPGESNGIQEFWIDDSLEARREGLNFAGTYTEYAINAVFFENYWNDGSIKEQKRYFDNIVVSTERIGCVDTNVHIIPRRFLRRSRGGVLACYEPFHNSVRVYYKGVINVKGPVEIIVYDLHGATVGRYSVKVEQILNGFSFNADRLSNGVYLVTVRVNDIDLFSSFSKVK